MQVESSPAAVRQLSRSARRAGQSIGVVPTMGALHQGHTSLIDAARENCGFVIATIFVNPTQFAPDEDFAKYPRTLEADLDKCRAAGADVVFTPNVDGMYSTGAQTTVAVRSLTQQLEGATRPTHFDGVTTVVAKLFNICEPDRAFFGQKDFQQQLVIRQMAEDLDFGLEVVTCPIVREADGLAMSSRNRYLNESERHIALNLSKSLSEAKTAASNGISFQAIEDQLRKTLLNTKGLVLDYAVVRDSKTLEIADDNSVAVALVAANVGTTRLIDNCVLPALK